MSSTQNADLINRMEILISFLEQQNEDLTKRVQQLERAVGTNASWNSLPTATTQKKN